MLFIINLIQVLAFGLLPKGQVLDWLSGAWLQVSLGRKKLKWKSPAETGHPFPRNQPGLLEEMTDHFSLAFQTSLSSKAGTAVAVILFCATPRASHGAIAPANSANPALPWWVQLLQHEGRQ